MIVVLASSATTALPHSTVPFQRAEYPHDTAAIAAAKARKPGPSEAATTTPPTASAAARARASPGVIACGDQRPVRLRVPVDLDVGQVVHDLAERDDQGNAPHRENEPARRAARPDEATGEAQRGPGDGGARPRACR